MDKARLLEMVHSDDREKMEKLTGLAYGADKYQEHEARFMMPDGRIRSSTRAVPLTNAEGRVTGLIQGPRRAGDPHSGNVPGHHRASARRRTCSPKRGPACPSRAYGKSGKLGIRSQSRKDDPFEIVAAALRPRLLCRIHPRLVLGTDPQDSPSTQILILSMHFSEELAREVLRAGALGCVLKSARIRNCWPRSITRGGTCHFSRARSPGR
jgi:hypothetical protein